MAEKRFSREKLKINQNFEWGNTEFTLLGIEFSTCINNMPEINYQRSIDKAKVEIKKNGKADVLHHLER